MADHHEGKAGRDRRAGHAAAGHAEGIAAEQLPVLHPTFLHWVRQNDEVFSLNNSEMAM